MKSSVGAVGLTENPSAFKKWMIAGPEQARLLKEFEQEYISEDGTKQQHHEEGMSTQKIFKEQALALVHTIRGMSNPFVDDAVRTVESVGRDQYSKYHDAMIKDHTY